MKKNKIIIIIISLLVLASCGFKPINQENANLIFFSSIDVEGDPRITNYIKNNILIISNKNSKNIYEIKLTVEKKKNIKIKDKTGKTKRYTLSLMVNLSLSDIQKNTIQKKFTQSEDYDVAKIHSNTIQSENRATKITIQKITDEIINFIILSMRNK
jgi:hypothetical protein